MSDNTGIFFSLAITPSRWMLIYLLLFYLALLVALWYLPLSGYWQWLALIVLLVFCFRNWKATMLHPVERLSCQQSGWVIVRGGVTVPIELRQITVWRWLIVLNFYLPQNRWQQSLVLFPDSAEQDSLRQLRVILRHLSL